MERFTLINNDRSRIIVFESFEDFSSMDIRASSIGSELIGIDSSLGMIDSSISSIDINN